MRDSSIVSRLAVVPMTMPEGSAGAVMFRSLCACVSTWNMDGRCGHGGFVSEQQQLAAIDVRSRTLAVFSFLPYLESSLMCSPLGRQERCFDVEHTDLSIALDVHQHHHTFAFHSSPPFPSCTPTNVTLYILTSSRSFPHAATMKFNVVAASTLAGLTLTSATYWNGTAIANVTTVTTTAIVT